MIVNLRDERAENVRVAGNATAVSEAEVVLGGRYNQLAGQEIIMYFDGRRLGSIDVRLTATSLYYLFDEGRPNGLNRSSGNAVRISFDGGRVGAITISENAEGQYVPEHLVDGREGEYNLTGFQWRETRPARDW